MARPSRHDLPFGESYADHPIKARPSKTCGAVWTVPSRARRTLTSCYFVDEAGDPVLFTRGGRVAIGREGCSRYFALGLTWALDPAQLERDLASLRQDLLADRYFANVPSMQREAKKTAIFFHAKDDVAEVRREVFKVLLRHPLQFFAVYRDKESLLAEVRAQQATDPAYRYHQNHVYDRLVTRLTRERLHRDGGYSVQFARRGASDRTAALSAAMERARLDFATRWGITSEAPLAVAAGSPQDSAGLQATDLHALGAAALSRA